MTFVRTASGVVSLADSSRVIQVWTWLRSARSALTTPSLALLDLDIRDRSSRGGQGRSGNLACRLAVLLLAAALEDDPAADQGHLGPADHLFPAERGVPALGAEVPSVDLPARLRIEEHHVGGRPDAQGPADQPEDLGRAGAHPVDHLGEGEEPRLHQLADGEPQRGLETED